MLKGYICSDIMKQQVGSIIKAFCNLFVPLLLPQSKVLGERAESNNDLKTNNSSHKHIPLIGFRVIVMLHVHLSHAATT